MTTSFADPASRLGNHPSPAPSPRGRRTAAAVLDAHRCGLDPEQIAQRCRVSKRTVERHLRGLGLTSPRETLVIDGPTHRLIEDLLDDGAPYTEIADTVGIPASAIAVRYPLRGWKQDQTAQFRRWLQLNESARELLHWKWS